MSRPDQLMNEPPEKVVVFCVGNMLMMDDGVGPAVFEELSTSYSLPPEIDLFDVGCMSLNMVEMVDEADYLVTVDAVDGTEEPVGTIFEFAPEDMARHTGAMASLHDLKLIDLFDAAGLLGYEAEGKCFGMQVLNRSPETVTVGLSKPVFDALPRLVDAVLADLTLRGHVIIHEATGQTVTWGWHHPMHGQDESSHTIG